MCNCAAFRRPNSVGTARYLAPLRWRRITASIVLHASSRDRPVPNRAAFSYAHSPLLNICIA